MPVFAIFCGIAIDAIRTWLMRFQRPRVPALATGALLVGIALWTAAFMNVYAEQQPRITASQWIYANVPPGSVLSSEYWDDALPLGFPMRSTPTRINTAGSASISIAALPANRPPIRSTR